MGAGAAPPPGAAAPGGAATAATAPGRRADGLCGAGCWAILSLGPQRRRKAAGPEPDATPKFQPRDPPLNGAPKLTVLARIAARKDDPESLDSLVTLKKPLDGLDEKGRTLLFYAVRGTRDDGGELEPAGGSMAGPKSQTFYAGCSRGGAARHLVEQYGFDVNFQVHDSGLSPLMEAARYGNKEAVQALLEVGADWRLRDARGHTALDIARLKLPEYLDLQEVQCSQTVWDVIKARIERDRMDVVSLIEAAGNAADRPAAAKAA